MQVKISGKLSLNYDFDYDQIVSFGELLSTLIVSEYLIELGIIDPAKVTKTALQNAISNALLILDTSGSINLVREEGEKKKKLMKV